MKKNIFDSQSSHPNKHTGQAQEPRRVASRMEGVVRNAGQKKTKKGKK